MSYILRSRTRSGIVALAVLAAFAVVTPTTAAQKKKAAPATFNVVPITFTSVTVENGALFANGLLGTTPFQAPLNLTAGPPPANGECPILNLQLGPIDLTLLGLNVETSPICLRITAIEGGGLLGDLLCDIANLLQTNALGTVLAGLTTTQLNTLSAGLTQVLNQAIVPVTSSGALLAASCNILNLSIGPLDLNILGLDVELDDCEGGPVTVDITAIPGGGLLGDLLCNLGDALNQKKPNPNQVLDALRQVVQIIGRLLG